MLILSKLGRGKVHCIRSSNKMDKFGVVTCQSYNVVLFLNSSYLFYDAYLDTQDIKNLVCTGASVRGREHGTH